MLLPIAIALTMCNFNPIYITFVEATPNPSLEGLPNYIIIPNKEERGGGTTDTMYFNSTATKQNCQEWHNQYFYDHKCKQQ